MKMNKKLYYPLLIAASSLIALPILFANINWLAGLFNVFGLFLFLFLNRKIEKRKEYIFTYLAFSLSFAIRFCGCFFSTIWIFLIGVLATFFIGLLICGIMFLTNFVSKSKIKIITPFVFPFGYIVIFIIMASIHFGNVFNIMNYASLLYPFSYDLSWASEYGLSFLLLTSYCFLLEIFTLKDKRKKVAHASIGIGIILSLSISGFILTPKNKEPDYILKVALATSEKRDFNGVSETPMSEEDYRILFESQVKKAYQENADLLLFQEEYATFPIEEEEAYLTYYSSILKSYHMPALIGASAERSEGKCKNNAYFFDGDGTLISTYQKVNVIPYIETIDYEGGQGGPAYFSTTLGGHEINISTVICFDLNNDLFMHQMNSNTELLLAPSWDWDYGNQEQTRTYVRAMEYDVTLVKHSYDGYSYVSTPYGLYGDLIDNRGKDSTITLVNVPIYSK